MRTLLATLCFLALNAFHANAETTVKQYKTAIASANGSAAKEVLKLYVKGLGEGISWASIMVEARKGPPLFCQPAKLALELENYIDILNAQIEKQAARLSQKDLDDAVIGMLLMVGLQETFPCNGK